MSTKNSQIAAGLCALGLAAWFATRSLAEPPPDPGPPQAQPGATGSPEPDAHVLLLSDGRLVQGTVLETDDGYLVKTPVGELPYRRGQVTAAFDSIQALYEYKRERTPDRDPDERLKLAQWCLSQGMNAEARIEVEAILALSPGLPKAKQMLFAIESRENEMAARTAPADDAIVRSSTSLPADAAPGMLSPGILRDLRDEYRRSPTPVAPVIFDLPEPTAIKRYRDFAAWVHPALQRACAQCHNEESGSSFQLIQARARRDLENELLIRANLDAALRLVDPREPSNSRLLSSSLMPHKPQGRPILTGPNHPTYRLLSTWVMSLHSPTASPVGMPAPVVVPAVAAQPQGLSPAQPAPMDATNAGGGFAADRGQAPTAPAQPYLLPPGTLPPAAANPTGASNDPNAMLVSDGQGGSRVVAVEPVPAGQLFPGSQSGKPQAVPDASQFQTSPLLGGLRPAPVGNPTQPGATVLPGAQGATQTIRLENGEEIPVLDPRMLDPSQTRRPAPTAADEGSEKPKTKIRRDVLQQFMSGKRGPAGPGTTPAP